MKNKTAPSTTPPHSARSAAVSQDYHGRVLDQPGLASGVGGIKKIRALNPTRTRPSAVPGMIETMGPG